MIDAPTQRQREILLLLEARQAGGEPPPSYREIGEHLGLPNVSAVAKHVAALRQKGFLATTDGKTRSIALKSPLRDLRHRIVHIPVFGSIPAGPPGDRGQDA